MKVATALVLLLLAGCGQSASSPAQPTWPGPIDRANRATWYDRPITMSGNDPAAWRAEVRQDVILVTPPRATEPLSFLRSPARLTADAGIYNSVASDGTTLQLSLQNNWCSFHYNEPLQPFTVEVMLVRPGGPGSVHLRGCGAQVGYPGARSAN